MNKDKYGEVINGEKTYKEIAYQLKARTFGNNWMD